MRIANYEYKSDPVQVQKRGKSLTNVPHLHKEIELVYVEKGSTVCFADEKVCTVEAGNIFISFPDQIHYYKHSENSLFRVLIITPDMFYGRRDLLYGCQPETNFTRLDDEGLKYLNMIYAASDKKDITEYVGWFNLLMTRILPKLKLIPASPSDRSSLQGILDFCSNHSAEALSLDYVSSAMHLSRCYISHLFSEKLGMGFNDYVNKLRVRRACDLLTDTDAKIADISEEVGFGSIRSFNRAFLKITGKTPAEYREKTGSQ